MISKIEYSSFDHFLALILVVGPAAAFEQCPNIEPVSETRIIGL